jgi:hypothetical protein
MFKVSCLFLCVVVACGAIAEEHVLSPGCFDDICIQFDNITLAPNDIKQLAVMVKKYENVELRFDNITLSPVIVGSIYLLSASKVDYYGVELILSKEGEQWTILKKIDSTY